MIRALLVAPMPHEVMGGPSSGRADVVSTDRSLAWFLRCEEPARSLEGLAARPPGGGEVVSTDRSLALAARPPGATRAARPPGATRAARPPGVARAARPPG